jgi:transcriptional regulator with XRE-family HTH domain
MRTTQNATRAPIGHRRGCLVRFTYQVESTHINRGRTQWLESVFPCTQGIVDHVTKHVAKTLRAARVAQSMTQEALAAELDVATETISHFERAVTAPSLKMIASAAAVLEVHLSDLFVGLKDGHDISRQRAEHEAIVRRLAHDLDDKHLALLATIATAIGEQA